MYNPSLVRLPPTAFIYMSGDTTWASKLAITEQVHRFVGALASLPRGIEKAALEPQLVLYATILFDMRRPAFSAFFFQFHRVRSERGDFVSSLS